MPARPPSKRRRPRAETDVELKLIPVMSLLVVLVPMLLQTAVFERTASIQVNLPSADEMRYLQAPDPEELEEGLTLAVTDEGFLLASGEQKLARMPPLPSGGLDFEGLTGALGAAKAARPAQDALILLVEDPVLYDDIVHTMDRCRPFFQNVALADRVQAPPEE